MYKCLIDTCAHLFIHYVHIPIFVGIVLNYQAAGYRKLYSANALFNVHSSLLYSYRTLYVAQIQYHAVCEINARQVANGNNIPSLSDLLFLP